MGLVMSTSVNPVNWMKIIRTSKAFERILEKVVVTNLKDGNCTAHLTISEEHANKMGTLHGGMSATLIDSLTSAALHSCVDKEFSSVSVNMNMTYIKGAKIGETIEIDANTVKVGKTLAFLEAIIRKKETGDLLVKGSHTKYILHR